MNNNGGEHSRAKEKLMLGGYKRKRKDDVAEDRCFFCKDGGLLMFCDQEECLKAYHPSCVNKDDSFINSGENWTCDVHFCFVCHQSPNLSCLACPKSLCKRCIGSVKFVQIKGEKGLCSTCLGLAIQVEENKSAVFDMFFENQFAGAWMVLSEKEHITLEDLSSAGDRMRKNECYISGINSDVDAEHVKICKGNTPMVKRKKNSLSNKIPSAAAAEREAELSRVKQEAEMEGTGIHLGDRSNVGRDASSQRSKIGSANNDGIRNGKNHSATAKFVGGDKGGMGRNTSSQRINIGSVDNDGIRKGDRSIVGQDASSRRSNIGSANNYGIGNRKNHSAAAKVIEGDRGIMGPDGSSRRSEIGSANNDGIGNGRNHRATSKVIEGDQGIMVPDASRYLKFGSSNNDGIGEGNDHDAAAKVTEGDGVMGQNASSQRITIGSTDNDGTRKGGQEVLDETASSKRTKRTNITKTGVVNDDATEQENPVSPIANVTEGKKEAEDSGPPFDKQAEAILKTRPEWYKSATEVLDQDFEWNVIVSEDGKVNGPYPLHSLKCLQDIYTVSSFLKVFKKGESKETAILLGDALKLLSI